MTSIAFSVEDVSTAQRKGADDWREESSVLKPCQAKTAGHVEQS
jgi:hypothetical protein